MQSDEMKRYREIFEAMPIPIWEDDFSALARRFDALREQGVVDLRGYLQQNPEELQHLVSLIRVVNVNPISLEFFDVSKKADLLGSIEGELTQDSRPAFFEEMVALYAGKTRFSAEVPIYTRQGERRIVFFCLAVPSGFEKSLERVLITFIDITDKEETEARLRESEGRFRFMADGLPLIIWVHDAQGKLKFVNRTYCEFFGITESQVYDQGWRPLLHPEDTAAYVGAFEECVRKRKPFHAECRVRRADGQWRWIESYGRPRFTPEGEFLGFVGTSPDITERKRAEAALLKSRDELEIRVAQRTQELQQRAEQLARLSSELTLAEQRERQRLAGMLHDNLQQILTSILFRMEKVGRRAGEAVRPDIGEIGELIKESIGISRSLTADLSPPILNEGGLVAGLEWLARSMAERYGLLVNFASETEDLHEPEDIRILLFQSVRELLINAAKHSGVSAADVKLQRVDSRRIAIVVKDRGKGFDPVDVETSAFRLTGGFGLFSIRERLDLMGGRMAIESGPGQGAIFTLYAPVRQKAETLEEPRAGQPASESREKTVNQGKIRILLADDHVVMRQGLSMLISDDEGMEIVGQASDGQEAVEMARQLTPDVILMDFSMPVMNGLEATRIISREMEGIRIIGLSMYDEAERAAQMLKAGAAAYVTKSGPADVLLSTIRQGR